VAGEDALLISEFIYEYARGMQIGEDSRYIKFVSTAKHFSMCEPPLRAPKPRLKITNPNPNPTTP
jgi:hypothetical protein